MKQFLFIGIGLLVVFGLVATSIIGSQQATQAYAPTGPGDIYLALGDSLAWGATLDDRGTESYPALLEQRLAERGVTELDNIAVPGETTGSFIRRQLPDAVALIERERNAGHRVSPITLDIGGNDLQFVRNGDFEQRKAAVATATKNIGEIMTMLRQAAGSDADIAVMTYYNPYGGNPEEVNSEGYWIEQLNVAIREEAGRYGIAVADTYAPFDGGKAYSYTSILIGDIHANALGHQVIAEQFWNALAYDTLGSSTQPNNDGQQ